MHLLKRVSVYGLAALAAIGGPVFAQPQGTSRPQQTQASAWKVFQELGFLLGSWSGTAEMGGRVGGRVVSWALEIDGAALTSRASAIFPASGDRAEEKSQSDATFVYDGDRRKYTAIVVFSSKVWGIYDVEIPSDGTVRMASRELLNLEPGAKSRISYARAADGALAELVEVALPGKDFVPVLSSKLNKK